MKLTARTGQIVGAGMVDDDHNLMLMSTSGKVIRLPVSQIPTIGRQTQGVTLMKLDPDEMVATMTIAEKKDDEGIRPCLRSMVTGTSPASPERAGSRIFLAALRPARARGGSRRPRTAALSSMV